MKTYWYSDCFIYECGAVRSQHMPASMGGDMNDPSAVARFRGQPYPPGPRQFDTYHRLAGPRLEAQQMYSVCQDSQQSNYQVCLHPELSVHSWLLIKYVFIWHLDYQLEYTGKGKKVENSQGSHETAISLQLIMWNRIMKAFELAVLSSAAEYFTTVSLLVWFFVIEVIVESSG